MNGTTIDSVENILRSAKKLDSMERISIAHALLKDLPDRLKKGITLPLLSGLSKQELFTLAKTSLSPYLNQRLKYLLRKNRQAKITEKESVELDKLLAESDQIALLKAKAQYTLKQVQDI